MAGRTHRGQVTELSERGAFLVTDRWARAGQELPLVVELGPEGGTVRCSAVVRSVRSDDQGRTTGLSVRFEHLPDAERFNLVAYLAQARPGRSTEAVEDKGRLRMFAAAALATLAVVLVSLLV